VSPLLLAILAVVDSLFTGFRAAAGRNPSLVKVDYFLRAVWRGMAVGVLAVGLGGVFVAVTMLLADDAAALYAAYHHVAARLVLVYGVYATTVLLAMLAWTYPDPLTRAAATVVVLGPFTLIRPIVIVAGASFALWGSTDWRVLAGCLWAVGCHLGGAWLLDQLARRQQRVLWKRLDEAEDPLLALD
jgi:hypothetical protein